MALCTNIDWSTFTFIAGSGQTLVSATELTGLNGTATFNQATKTIEYELGTASCLVDPIAFQVSDVDGNVSNISTWYVDTTPITAPTLTGDSLTLAAGEIKLLNAVSNDTGNINKASYEVVTQPTKVSVANNNDGTFNIIASDTVEGSDSFTYRAATPEGVYGSPATVSLTIQNAGLDGAGTICPVTGIDLTSFLVGDVTSGGTWAADPDNLSTPSLADPTDVDFDVVKAGTYIFTYTVGDSVATITLTLPAYGVTIDSVSTPTSNPLAAAVTSTVQFTTIGVISAANISIEVDFNSGTSIDTYEPDTWNAETGVGTVVVALDNGTGDYDITVSAIDSCGTTGTATASTITL